MSFKTFYKFNFHKHTFCIFKEVTLDSIKDLKPNFKSKSGSSYYFIENGVYRLSNHWSRVANCRWKLISENVKSKNERTKLGFAKWTDFHPDNDFEKLYFIEIKGIKEVNYFHKNNENYSNQVLRTSVETTKLIKQIRTLIEETAWAKYLNNQNIEVLRQEIIEKMITSDKGFQEIRREYL